MNDQATPELHELCTAAAEGQLDDAGQRRLNELVRDDEAARRFYVAYLEVHALLHWRHGSVEPLEMPLASPPGETRSATPVRTRNRWLAGAALAAVAVAVLVLISVTGHAPWQRQKPSSEPIAIVVDEDDVRWNSQAYLDDQQQLRPGRQRIASGVAHIELQNGVLLAAAGPVDFEITAPDHIHLHRGKLHIYSPLATRGFTVTTPRGVQIVDLGTRFGVWADDDDAVHVHLFEGRLQVNGRIDLQSGQAVTIDAEANAHDEAIAPDVFPPLHQPQP